MVHRDYKNASDIVIKVFDDRIVISSPGRLFGKLTIADLKRDDYSSSIRNKLLAEAFYLTGDIEKYGTGFIRIREWLKAYPEIRYDIRESGDAFVAELFHSGTGGLKTDTKDLKKDLKTHVKDLKTEMGLSKIQAEIVSRVLENGWVTQQELSTYVGISPRNIRKNMDVLKAKGLLKRIGPQKGGHWKIIFPEEGPQSED